MDTAQKLQALSELDTRIYEDVVLRHEGAEAYTPRTFPYHSDTQELIAPARFRAMYVYYLCLEADLALDEIERYTNDLLLFNEAYAAYCAHYNETHMPLHPAAVRTAPAYQRGDSYAG